MQDRDLYVFQKHYCMFRKKIYDGKQRGHDEANKCIETRHCAWGYGNMYKNRYRLNV